MMEKRLYIIIAILFLSFPYLAYGEVAHSFPLSSDAITAHNDMQIEPAVQVPGTNGWQKKKKDSTFQSSPSKLIEFHQFPYKHSISSNNLANPHLFLTPYFFQGSYLTDSVI
ncbi:hypothetical protein [Bacillus sp. RO1]|uniref:hypothetical protein n=1 Tax=Bacillus sp. RO1 TaxID=2722703 RepID=UPI00145636E5|nr:hypothetical protein [Bacillus sp. RO1]NLP51186.1 hypothetical protein [Bacillus sp. RO1]